MSPRVQRESPSAHPRGRSRQAPSLDDFWSDTAKVRTRVCDHPQCSAEGSYRAPKGRDLNEYFWFCLEHVQAYNKAWNYYAGMSESAIEDEIRRSTVWDRPTWPLGEQGPSAVRGRGSFTVNDPFSFAEREFAANRNKGQERRGRSAADGPRARALRILDLEEPVTLESLKVRYKALVKQCHPDVNGGDADAEERFKLVNEAYRTLLRSLKEA